MKTTSVVPLIQEAERTVRELVKHFGLRTDPNNIVITIQTKGRKNALGWFWANRWKGEKKELVHEINMSAEHLKDCDSGELIIHEMAHAENKTLDIKDCSARVHNKHFKSMAERLGLKVKPRDKAVGFGYTELDKPAEDFLKKMKFDKDIFSMARLTPTSTAKAGTRLLKLECKCGYTVRTTQKWIEVGMPTCPCGEEMEVS